MAEFDPRQLDQLEDALESLEDIDDLASLELSPELTARLGEYKDVLALCREAFPSESPPQDLLAGVLAEAREVSRRPSSRDGDRSRWRQFWERWRGTLVPGFALAGTAAAVLWLLDPSGDNFASDDLLNPHVVVPDDDRAGEAKSDEKTQPASDPSEEPEQDEPAPTVDPLPEIEPEPKSKPEPELKQKKIKSAGTEPAPAVEPTPEPLSKEDTWNSLERADAQRRTGNCDRARSLYDEVIAASSDSRAVAQARAGIGLCLEQDRRDGEASSWYEQARSASPDMDAWIRTERDRQPTPGEKKKRRSKKTDAFESESL